MNKRFISLCLLGLVFFPHEQRISVKQSAVVKSVFEQAMDFLDHPTSINRSFISRYLTSVRDSANYPRDITQAGIVFDLSYFYFLLKNKMNPDEKKLLCQALEKTSNAFYPNVENNVLQTGAYGSSNPAWISSLAPDIGRLKDNRSMLRATAQMTVGLVLHDLYKTGIESCLDYPVTAAIKTITGDNQSFVQNEPIPRFHASAGTTIKTLCRAYWHMGLSTMPPSSNLTPIPITHIACVDPNVSAAISLKKAFAPEGGIDYSKYLLITPDGVYKEGAAYSSLAMQGLATFLFFMEKYGNVNMLVPATSHLAWIDSNFPNLRTRMAAYIDWMAASQNYDGSWPPMNDSSKLHVNAFFALPLFHYLFRNSSNTGFNLALKRMYAANWIMSGKDRFDIKGWRVLAPKYISQIPSLVPRTDRQAHLFATGGHLFLKDPIKKILGRFYNEGSFWSDRGSIFPRSASHKRYNETHFEISAFGKDLLIGPGHIEYDTFSFLDWLAETYPETLPRFMEARKAMDAKIEVLKASYDGHRYPDYALLTAQAGRPDSHNMLRVDWNTPKTVYLGNFLPKIAKLDGNANDHLYVMNNDLYRRYILWGKGKYFLIFDSVNSGKNSPLELTLHGRGTMTVTSLSTESDYQKIVMIYGERYPSGLSNTRLHPDADPSIRLNIYPGYPTARRSISNPFTIKIRSDGFDTGHVGMWTELYNTEASGKSKYFYCNHDVAVFYKAMGKVMPAVYWPYKLPEAEPSVVWSYIPAAARFTVAISAAGINDTWRIPENGGINSLAALR